MNNYFDLTKRNLSDLYIDKKDYLNCQLVDNNGEIFDGFLLAKSEAGNILTLCDIDFSKTKKNGQFEKYQARLTFRKTNNKLEQKKTRANSEYIIISFKKGQAGYREFWKMIAFLYKWKEMIDLDEFEDLFAITDKDVGEILPLIANLEHKEKVLENLGKLPIKDLSNITNLVSITKIKDIIDKWEDNKTNYDEEFWQKTFQTHNWILSQIFACPTIQIRKKFYCGGKEDDNKGGVEGDLLYQNKLTGNLAFIEIKTPKLDIIIGKQYRGKEKEKENVIYSMHQELTGAVNQVLNQKKVYHSTYGEKKSKFINNIKCVLIIGITPDDDDKIKSFELYRKSLIEVEIITYDELFERIKSILTIFNS